MLFNVPQFIETEDKIVGPFTAKQLGWLAIGGVILLILYNLLDMSAFIIAAIIVGGIFGALAFYRPYNQPLIKLIFSSMSFAFHPKLYVWDRFSGKIETRVKPVKKKPIEAPPRKTLDRERLKKISQMLDLKK